jgi:hypothetical protein
MPASRISTAHRVTHAMGYLELGMLVEAEAELEAIQVGDRLTPPVLLARMELHMVRKNWEPLIALAKAVAFADPAQERAWIGWAYALRCLERVGEARAVLLEADRHHGKTCGLLHYNLACYECLLGNLEQAKLRLDWARELGEADFKKLALEDSDLAPLWDHLARLP